VKDEPEKTGSFFMSLFLRQKQMINLKTKNKRKQGVRAFLPGLKKPGGGLF